jgi:N-acetylglucosamine kinase-like BadF-type ATPase
MLLVADSGSTKADWKFGLSASDIAHTPGFNPFFHDENFMLAALEASALLDIRDKVSYLYFFGAGCSSEARNAIVETALRRFFRQAKVVVDHDIKAAAIATNGDEAGISCIIGTGSNSCFYDGKELYQMVPSLGYLLGDEASGGYLGKRILADFLYKKLPKVMEDHLRDEYKVNKETIFENCYRKPHANVYMATFARLCSEYRREAYVQNLLRKGFTEFLETHTDPYPKIELLPINFVGSIAYHFQDELTDVLHEKKRIKGRIIQKPIDALYRYFAEKMA